MKYTMHDPRLHKLPYPYNLILAIAKADLIDPNDRTSHKPPVIDVDSELEEFITIVPLVHNLTNYEAEVITRHYEYHVPLIDIADHFCCTAENIRSHRNHALNKLLKAYLNVKKPVNEPVDELPAKPEWLKPQVKHIKAAKNSIKKYRAPRKHKPCVPYKLYIRSDGILYLEIKDEIAQHYIGEFYTYSNSNFSIEGIVVDISLTGILLTDWEVTRK